MPKKLVLTIPHGIPNLSAYRGELAIGRSCRDARDAAARVVKVPGVQTFQALMRPVVDAPTTPVHIRPDQDAVCLVTEPLSRRRDGENEFLGVENLVLELPDLAHVRQVALEFEGTFSSSATNAT